MLSFIPPARRILSSAILLYFILSLLFFSCVKKTEEFQSALLNEYIPLQTGKYIVYRIDSTVYINFGTITQIHSYQEKHIVDAEITDNLGRPSFRIFRYLRDSAGTEQWNPVGTYFITPLSKQVELIEDNLRIIKLHLPLKKDFKWKGNSYLTSDAYFPIYTFNNDDFMPFWDFVITRMNETISLNNKNITDVMTISEADEIFVPDTLTVSNNRIVVPDKAYVAWITGIATDTVSIIPPSASTVTNSYGVATFGVANRSNYPARLNGIIVPPGKNRSYRYSNGQWTYPLDLNNNIDTTVSVGAVYALRNFAVEKYAKNIGLVYRELIMWDFQPTYVADEGFKTGFGIRMWMFDHN